MFESIQGIHQVQLGSIQEEGAMHPVNYLFEDIYGNDWGIVSDAATRKRRDKVGPWRRDLQHLVKRKRS
jgi:hypothetical protein